MASTAAIRVRYAPSPTGLLHLGGLRTALFNYLFARRQGGQFLLRIEDTDRARHVPGSVAAMVRALRWCGLDYDEGPELAEGAAAAATQSHTAAAAPPPPPLLSSPGPPLLSSRGPCGPYIQSQRLHHYAAASERLLHSGAAYRCFCSMERLAALREDQLRRGQPTLYDRACASLPGSEAERRAAAREPHVVRLRVPGGSTVVRDSVVGDVTFAHAGVDDQVLLKSDGFPTYHLAAVVDDHLMAISHVIRGQEWLSSTPKHVLLYGALGWAPPSFSHLPLLLNTDRSKLSKRHGDAAVEDFAAAGFSPEGLVNFVALLGWTPPSGAGEVMSLPQLVEAFDLGAVNKSNAVVDRARLAYFNGMHIRRAFAGRDGGGAGGSGSVEGDPMLRRLVETVAPLLDAALVRLGSGCGCGARIASDGKSVRDCVEGPLGREHACGRDASCGREQPRTPSTRDPPSTTTAQQHCCHRCGAPLPSPAPAFTTERLLDVMAAQHERVHVAPEFVDLVLPFVADAAQFRAWLAAQARTPAFDKLRSQLLLPAVAAGARAAPTTVQGAAATCPPAAATAAAASDMLLVERFLARVAPLLTGVADTWDALPPQAPPFEADAHAGMAAFKAVAAAHGVKPAAVMLPARFALTGMDVGASLSDTLRLLGRETSTRRLRFAADSAALWLPSGAGTAPTLPAAGAAAPA